MGADHTPTTGIGLGCGLAGLLIICGVTVVELVTLQRIELIVPSVE